MRIYSNKIGRINTTKLINRSNITGDVYTATSRIFSVQGVIIQKRQKRVLHKHFKPLIKLFAFAWTQIFIALLKVSVKTRFHPVAFVKPAILSQIYSNKDRK